ncbi:MAG: ECF transporter S component, partial [Chloroflexota bacterium]
MVDQARKLFQFSTRDILLMVTIAIVFGLLTAPLQLASSALSVSAPFAQRLLSGAYMIAPLFGAVVFRRIGVAFLIPLLSSLVWVGTTPFGFAVILLGLFLGVYCETGVAIACCYRNFNTIPLIVAGMIAGALSFVISSVLFQLTNITIWIGLGYLVLQMISGGIAGYLAVQLAHIIQRAGL